MEWTPSGNFVQMLSNKPLSFEEFLELTQKDLDERKCNIVFPF